MIKIQDGFGLAVEIKNFSKRYGNQLAVDGLSLSVPVGSTFGLIGANGAGKSTTLKALMGLVRFNDGFINVLGHDINKVYKNSDAYRLRQRIGYVPEVHHMYRWMKIREIIGYVRSFYKHWNEQLSRELLDFFNLDPEKKIKQLSKGMHAKLALLLAVCHEPDLLILDEPTSGLDPLVREEFLHGVLKTISQKETTVIFSSHSIHDVERMADVVGLLKHGKLIVNQSISNILEKTKRVRAVLDDNSEPNWFPNSVVWQRVNLREWEMTVNDFSDDILSQISERNPVQNVEVRDLSLEDIFKDYVRESV